MGQGQEDRVGPGGDPVRVHGFAEQFRYHKVGKQRLDRLARGLLRRDGADPHLGVAEQETQEFPSHVATGPDYCDRCHPEMLRVIKKGRPRGLPFGKGRRPFYRFENWKRLRAPFCPYFFRSFVRESRVSMPSFFKAERKAGSIVTKAFDTACRRAPAWPELPPPSIVAVMSSFP